MKHPFVSIEKAIEELQHGRMIILVDDEDRENEGDLVVAAEKITPEMINFMITYGRGLVCLSLHEDHVKRLKLPMMTQSKNCLNDTAFTLSIEAAHNVTTGVSVQDRAHTILMAINPHGSSDDLVTPGHVFPLRARASGVLERGGHTEASVDLATLAGLNRSAVLCEILNTDGSMARLPDLIEFGMKHRLKIVSISELVAYRLINDI